MNEEIDESEFYHQDFTTASEWEIFIARIEQIVNQWKVDDYKQNEESNPVTNEKWIIKSETLPFADVEFTLNLYRKKDFQIEPTSESSTTAKAPIDTLYDFELDDGLNSENNAACLNIWYGLNEYITLNPVKDVPINSESRIKLLLSAVTIVAGNTLSEIPIFIQIREKKQNYYLGVFQNMEMRTNFEMVHLKRGPRHCQYLTGLLDLFKTKIMSSGPLDTVNVSVQFTYNLIDFGNYVWKQESINVENDNIDSHNLSLLPFGVSVDPISTIFLKTTWSYIPDHLVVDSEGFSDFDPLQAPKWSLLTLPTEQPICLLADCLNEFLYVLINNYHTVYDILGDFAALPAPDNNPLDLLTESTVPSISSLITRAARTSLSRTSKGAAPLSEEILVPMLYYLFPDADDNTYFPYENKTNEKKENKTDSEDSNLNLEHECRGLKTCIPDTLIWRLTTVLAHSLHSLGGTRAFAHLWYEFAHEMRYRWENNIPIKGLQPGFPDLRTCLLNQKLQMLNCCIERKIARENTRSSQHYESAENSSDEEFFDCSNENPEEEAKRREKHSLWNQPVGRLGKFGNLKLLETGDPLYIPITQDPVPKSEDQLEEDTDVLMQLGSDAEASELRAKLMSASLLSDMESFKAANPGSILEDFIRWYSPRDWIDEDELDEWGQNKGHLSPRMALENNNIWVEMWKSSKPVPANRQKRLFDDTREAEKVLHFLDSRNMSQVSEMILPILIHSAIYRVEEEAEQVAKELPDCNIKVKHLIKHAERISRDVKPTPRRLEAFIQEMSLLELNISQVNSLMYKLNPSGSSDESLSNVVKKLVNGCEIEIENKMNSAVGNRIMGMFSDAQKVINLISNEQGNDESKNLSANTIFPQPYQREFVMRVSASRPATYSTSCPQFLRAILSKNEFRLAGAFSEDIVFF